jgi:hypothetical protein
MSLCKYKTIFGEPGEGVHSVRIFGVALVDEALTILGAYGISKSLKIDFLITLVALHVIAFGAHRAFCVNTTLNKLVFGSV